jgi:hypothetical protein
MSLLIVFIISLVIGEAIAVGVGLLVERHTTPYTGLVTFIACYFAMFWLAWRFAVRSALLNRGRVRFRLRRYCSRHTTLGERKRRYSPFQGCEVYLARSSSGIVHSRRKESSRV